MDKIYFRVFFTGLCSFVPDAAQTTVLLVDSSEPPDLPHDHGGKPYESHVPVLICDAEAVEHSSRRPDAFYYYGNADDVAVDGTAKLKAIFFLDDQELQFKEYSLVNPEDVANQEGVCPKDNDNDKGSSYWITSLAKVSPGSEFVDAACLALEGVHPGVAARVKLKKIKLKTIQLAIGKGDHVLVWQFKVPGAVHPSVSHRQAAAAVVGFDGQTSDDITLSTELLRTSGNPRVRKIFGDKLDNSLEIKISFKASGNNVIWIKNMPWPDILGTRVPETYEQGPDVHFSHFYKVAANYKEANVPHPFGLCAATDSKHQGNPNCQPVMAKPPK
jgi:hypothetical protein